MIFILTDAPIKKTDYCEEEMDTVIVFNIILGTIFCLEIFMQFALNRTMKRSLYLYRNVSLVAGIIFGFVLMVALYSYLISCLRNLKIMSVYNIFKEFISFPEKFAHFALPVFIIICSLVIISNIALIRHEGRRLKNVLGILLGLVFVGGTILNTYIEKIIEKYVLYDDGPFDTPAIWSVHTYLQLFLLLIICYLEVYFIATVIMSYLATKQVPTCDRDFIIILGCSIDKRGGLLPLLKGRTNRAIKYAWEQELASGKPLRYIPSGGQGPREVISEGSAMELYLLSHGAEKEEVFAEKESKNTYENFLYSKKIIDSLEPNAKVAFATTNYHMYRSGMLAKKVGLDAEGISSKTKWYFWPNGFVREYIAIMAMEKKFHIINVCIIALLCIILAFISFYIFKLYWL